MKIQLEKVKFEPGKSFRVFMPSLRNYFFWHYHPEYELVFVEAVTGIRHVGQHVSDYIKSDLILIGPNIPHLNFDYGVKTEYKQIVVQLRENFLGTALAISPEFDAIQNLFKKSVYGLSFTGKTKKDAVEKLKSLQQLDHFQQLLCLLEILQILALSKEVLVLNDMDTSIRIFFNDKIRMASIYEYIHAHYNKNPDVNKLAKHVHLSTPAFCRYFKKQTKMTFTDFVNQYRINQAKTLMLHGENISGAGYSVGFDSISHFSKVFKKMNGVSPLQFKKKYLLD
ncbi:MAG: helix-turn-helix domain-containing protein [Bacteroidetes bacterium]|nr:helix-turn-helix domain-containing protein [Bacteroidota bacterium]